MFNSTKHNLPVKKGYVEASAGVIHYRCIGARENPHLLLLHQTASSSAMYVEMMRRLAGEYYIFAPDTPGFGGSDNRDEPATMEFYAAALREAADEFGLTDPFLFGHHTGASIAVEMEFQGPFATKMLLSGPPYLSAEQKAAFKAGTKPIVLQPDGSHMLKVWNEIMEKDPSIDLELAHRECTLKLHAGTRFHEAYHAVFDHEFETRLAAIDCPVMVVAGNRDTLKNSLEPAYNALKNGEMRRIEGNTFVCDQSPDVMATMIREYCK